MLRNWLKGEVGIKEERQLEQLAKEDAFLEDALEGYRSMPEKNHLKATTQLKARLRNRSQKRRRALGFYRVAAAVAFLITASAGFWYLNKPVPETKDIAHVETDQSEEPPALTKEDASIQEHPISIEREEKEAAIANLETNSTSASSPKTRKKSIKTKTNKRSGAPKKKEAIDQFAFADEVIEEESVKEEKSKLVEKEIASTSESRPASVDALEGRAAGIQASANRQITGTVKDDMGEPLIGANVIVNGTPSGTVTDVDGRFQLQIDSTADKLDISYTGFQLKSINIEEKNEIDVVLDSEDIALDEVVVTGQEVKRKRLSTASTATISAPIQPRSSFKKLERHIRKNLKYPQTAKDNKIEGNVILSFTINDNGKPENILVTKSLGYGCNEEAIRLLKTGPKWKPKGGQGSYTIPFKLSNH